MKLLLALFALVSLGIFVPSMHADPVLSVNAGVAGGTLVEVHNVADVWQWTYADVSAGVLGQNGVATADANVFTATFTYVPLGVSVLNVTDVCANLAVIGSIPNPCSLGFSFSDSGVGLGTLASNDPYDPLNLGVVNTDLNIALGADIGIGVLGGTNENFGLVLADIGGGQANIDFPPPPPGGGNGNPAATPEPGTLSLMGTGLLGLAGVVRRKFRTA